MAGQILESFPLSTQLVMVIHRDWRVWTEARGYWLGWLVWSEVLL